MFASKKVFATSNAYKHKMTKLVEWLLGIGLFLGVWSAFLTKNVTHPLLEENWIVVQYLPIIALFLFGVYALTIVLWRVYTFNDCEDAVNELAKQILLAREDLESKGFVFNDEQKTKKKTLN